jgi:hypothetical protein
MQEFYRFHAVLSNRYDGQATRAAQESRWELNFESLTVCPFKYTRQGAIDLLGVAPDFGPRAGTHVARQARAQTATVHTEVFSRSWTQVVAAG